MKAKTNRPYINLPIPLAWVIFTSLLTVSASTVLLNAASDRPNIVVLFVDDLGWNDLASNLVNNGHGSLYHQTPNIDRLAEQGMSFPATYVSPNCLPSRAALLSGQYAPRTGMYAVNNLDRGDPEAYIQPPTQTRVLDENLPTIGTALQEAGYLTAHFGKWHVGNNFENVEKRGFHYSYSEDGAEFQDNISYIAIDVDGEWEFNRFGPRMHQFAQPYDLDYINEFLVPYANGNDPTSLVGHPKHLTDAMADATADFLFNKRMDLGPDQPFFLYVCFNIPHTPIEPREDLVTKYSEIPYDDPRHHEVDYAAFVEHMDQVVARILDQLEEASNNTIVIFTSDNGAITINGPRHNEPLRAMKGTHYEGGIRVPFIAHWPDHIPQGAVNQESIHIIDLYPTVLELAGEPLPSEEDHILDGQSIAPLFLGEKEELERDALYAHFPGYLGHPFIRSVPLTFINKRVGDERYKLFYFYETQSYEMYNLTEDIGESNNLIVPSYSEDTRAIAADLRADMLAWLEEMDPLPMTVRATGELIPPPVKLPDAQPPTDPGEASTPYLRRYEVDEHTIEYFPLNEEPGSTSAHSLASGKFLSTVITGDTGGFGAEVPAPFVLSFHAANETAVLQSADFTQNADLQGPDGAFTYELLVRVDDTAVDPGATLSIAKLLGYGRGSNSGQLRLGFTFDTEGNLNVDENGNPDARFIFWNTANDLGGNMNLNIGIPATGLHAFRFGEWYHMAVTYDGNDNIPGNFRTYWTRLDSQVNRAFELIPPTGQHSPARDQNISDQTGNVWFVVGGNANAGNVPGTNDYFVDEVRISSIARDPGDFVFIGNGRPLQNFRYTTDGREVSEWYGDFNFLGANEFHSARHGAVLLHGDGDDIAVYQYELDHDRWMYTGDGIYPHMYLLRRDQPGRWLYHVAETHSPERYFWDFGQETWLNETYLD